MNNGLGYKYNEAAKCRQHGLVFVPFNGRCETPEVAALIIRKAQNKGLGFLSPGGDDSTDDYSFDEWNDYGYDDWLYYDYFSSGGGLLPDLPIQDINYPTPLPGPGISAGSPFQDIADYLSNWFYGLIPTIQSDAPYRTGSTTAPTNIPDYGSSPNYPGNPGQGTATDNLQTALPGYCPGGTYHPLNDPYACVPFPTDDATKKAQAKIQRKGQQQQARQKRQAQQQANKSCPKDKQNRPVWRNPKTGQCELVPVCGPGQSFDQVTGRCLTSAQKNELYGSSGNWIWWIIGGVVFVMLATHKSEQKPMRRKR